MSFRVKDTRKGSVSDVEVPETDVLHLRDLRNKHTADIYSIVAVKSSSSNAKYLRWQHIPITVKFNKTGAFAKNIQISCNGFALGSATISLWMSNANGAKGSNTTITLSGTPNISYSKSWSDSGTYNYMNCTIAFPTDASGTKKLLPSVLKSTEVLQILGL